MNRDGAFTPGGMPRRWQNYKFSWDKDLYARKVFVKDPSGKKYLFNETSVPDIFPAEILEALGQLNRGGSIFRPSSERSPADFVKVHGITRFDDGTNKRLTQDYGVGFASAVYRYLLESLPQNVSFREVVTQELENKEPARTEFSIVIARGYAHTVMGNDLFRYLQEDLTAMGFEVIMAETDAFGRLEQNQLVMKRLLEEQKARGKNTILIGTCVGLVASLAALEEIVAKDGVSPIQGLINIAGMLRGSFVVDWGTRYPQWFFIRRGLYKEYQQKGGAPAKIQALEAMKDFRFERISTYMDRLGKVGVLTPKTLNFVSILPGNGLGREKSGIRRMQDQVIRPNLKKSFGANDGIIEYPGTVLPEEMTSKNISLVFQSSHNFLDGYFEHAGQRFDLRNDEQRRETLGSIFRAFIRA